MTVGLRRTNPPRFSEKDRTAKRKRFLLPAAVFCVPASLTVFLLLRPEKAPSPPAESTPPWPAGPDARLSGDPGHQKIEGEVREGSSFFKSLREKNVPVRWIELIISKLKPYVNFKKIRGGADQLILDVNGEMVRFVYEEGPTDVYQIEKGPDGYVAEEKEIPLRVSTVTVGGEIRSSLFEAMDALGEGDLLVLSFAEILASEVDFYKDVKEGDRFTLVVEKLYKGDEFIRYGTIHAVQYQRGEKTIRGIRYKDGYYDDKGNSLRKAFLKVPLRFSRISSKFSRARNHPILGGVRPHYGVDYAAPPGTPVWAVSDGTVVSSGWGGGFGNQVVLRHRNGYVSCYGHLSGFGPGIRRGGQVKQQQVIGYVGSTGLSTGPHLDYRLVKDGKFRNPLKETFPAGVPLRREEMDEFLGRKEEVLSRLKGDSPLKEDRASGSSP